MTDKLAPSERFRVINNGQVVYEWDQTIDEVNIYVPLPPGASARHLSVDIRLKHLKIGLKGNPPYLDHDLGGKIKTEASFWTVEDGELHITLTKFEKAAPWKAAISGHEIQAYQADQEAKRLMLERFQSEHPGFDFSGAEFSGNCPDPSSFLGGPSNH